MEVSKAVDVLLVVDEGVDHLPGLWVRVGFISTAVHGMVEGAVVISHEDSVFSFALVGYVVDGVPEAIGVVF